MDLRANAIITAVDRFSAPVQRMAGALNALSSRSAAVASAARKAGSALAGPSGFGAMMGSGLFLKSQLDFEQSLNRTQAILNETSKEGFRPLRDEIVRVAKAYPAMRREIAEGVSEMAMAGMKQDVLIATTEAMVQGAMASNESIRTVGEGVTDIILGMALPFKTAAEQAKTFAYVNDVLASSATSANDTYVGFLEALRRAGPVARTVGIDLEHLAAMHGVLANAGIKSERSGIAMRSMFVRALAPTKRARQLMRAWGIDWSKWAQYNPDAQFNAGRLAESLSEAGIDADNLPLKKVQAILDDPALKGDLGSLGDRLTEVIARSLGIDPSQTEDRSVLGDAIREYLVSMAAKLDPAALFKELADKNAPVPLLKELLSLHHVEKAAVLQEAFAAGKFDDMLAEIERKIPGATKRFADIMMQGFVGAWYRMKSAVDAFGDTLANTGVMDTLTGVFNKITDGVNAIGQTNPRLLEWGTYAMLFAGAASAVSLAFSGLVTPVTALAGALAAAPLAATLTALAAAITALVVASNSWDPDKGLVGSAQDYWQKEGGSWRDWFRRRNEEFLEAPTPNELFWGRDNATDIWGRNIHAQRLEKLRQHRLRQTGGRFDFGAGQGMVRDIAPTAGPQTVDVTGKVDAEVQGTVSGKMELDVHFTGPGQVTDKRGGEISGTLNTGKTMPDAGGR
jgi:hypothetical protein